MGILPDPLTPEQAADLEVYFKHMQELYAPPALTEGIADLEEYCKGVGISRQAAVPVVLSMDDVVVIIGGNCYKAEQILPGGIAVLVVDGQDALEGEIIPPGEAHLADVVHGFLRHAVYSADIVGLCAEGIERAAREMTGIRDVFKEWLEPAPMPKEDRGGRPRQTKAEWRKSMKRDRR